jgi:hypothetical protein
VDVLNIDTNRLETVHLLDLPPEELGIQVDLIGTRDPEMTRQLKERGKKDRMFWIPTFDPLLSSGSFAAMMRKMLKTLEDRYGYPVDIEFTVNFFSKDRYRINLVQCRPLQVQGTESIELPRVQVEPADRIMAAEGAVIGHSRHVGVARFIYVVPSAYGGLSEQARYEVARLLGEVNRAIPAGGEGATVLLGPGRWGTTTPALGVPVTFIDINRVSVLVEIVGMREHLVPDVSLGTHFLNDLVEMDMLYLALLPGDGESLLNAEFFASAPNRLLDLVPDAGRWESTVRVIDCADVALGGDRILLTADAVEQRAICYVARAGT